MRPGHVVFVDFHPPHPRFGCAPTLRHLVRLNAAGFPVTAVFHELGTVTQVLPAGIQPLALPARKRWWPPHWPRSRTSILVRIHLWTRAAVAALRHNPPRAVLTRLSPYMSQLAGRMAAHFGAPLHVFYQDEVELQDVQPKWVRRETQSTLRQAARIWCVSDFLLEQLTQQGLGRSTRLLWPVPQGASDLQRSNCSGPPRVFHGGTLHHFQLAPLGRIAEALHAVGGSLEVVCPERSSTYDSWAAAHPNIRLLPPFPTSGEAISHLAQTCSAFAVVYAERLSQQPWSRSSFPSKLVEFVHTGLPGWIAAPPEAAASTWARRHRWIALHTPEDGAGAERVANALQTPDDWQRMAAQSRAAAATDFSAERLHQQFFAEIILK